jgi:hypothetical protein
MIWRSCKRHADYHPPLIEDQEKEIVQDLLTHTAEDIFLHKGEFLDEIECVYINVLTPG